VNNSGDNLSNGQKQLLCLARAILQDNVCLIMDEPTSSVDDETENKLLEAIKKSFNGRTVITIAVITIFILSIHLKFIKL
jgi:ABC-type multidrug transport system fused ATPase/permease subunit